MKISSPKNRHKHTLVVIEEKKLAGFGQFDAKTGKRLPPIEQRELSQQEAAEYLEIAPSTLRKWSENGLKAIVYGQRKRYMLSDLEEFLRSLMLRC